MTGHREKLQRENKYQRVGYQLSLFTKAFCWSAHQQTKGILIIQKAYMTCTLFLNPNFVKVFFVKHWSNILNCLPFLCMYKERETFQIVMSRTVILITIIHVDISATICLNILYLHIELNMFNSFNSQPISQLTHLTGVRSALYVVHIQITFIVPQGGN